MLTITAIPWSMFSSKVLWAFPSSNGQREKTWIRMVNQVKKKWINAGSGKTEFS
jgi:hypothetical protein